MSREIDLNTGFDTKYKRPSEVRQFTFDLSGIMDDDDVISSMGVVLPFSEGRITGSVNPVLSAVSFIAGTQVGTLDISGGTDGENYKIAGSLTTTLPEVIPFTFMLKVRNS